MKQLDGLSLPLLPVTGLERVRDLAYHDGPLISHLRRGTDHYIYYWCDCTEKLTRWMLLRVAETDIVRLAERIKPVADVIPRKALDPFVYIVDVAAQGAARTWMVQVEKIPETYRPRPGFKLEAIQEADLGIAVVLQDTESTNSILELPKVFRYAYSVMYALFQSKLKQFPVVPYREGFGGMRFYNWMLSHIPEPERPKVLSMQFASPGFVRFNGDRAIADHIFAAINVLQDNPGPVDTAFRKLTAYIRDSRLDAEKESLDNARFWKPYNEPLKRGTRALLDAAEIYDEDVLIDGTHPYEGAKIALSLIKRLRELRDFERDQIAIFPEPLED